MIHITPYKDNQVSLGGEDICQLNLIRERFSTPNPACRANMPWMPKRLYSITPSFKYEVGLTPAILKFLTEYPIPFKVDPEVQNRLQPGKETPTGDLLKLDRDYREYQDLAIRKSISIGRGIVKIATSGGKTLIMAGLIHNWCPKKTVVIVPNIQLVEQTQKDFVEYGLKSVSKWSGKNPLQKDSEIIVVNTQILLSESTDLNFLEQFDLVLIDECHQFGVRSNQNNKVFKFIQTPNIFGFTGTLPPDKIGTWNIIGKIGPVIFEEGVKGLLQKGFITPFEVVMIELNHKDPFKTVVSQTEPTKAYREEQQHLMDHPQRNGLIIKLVTQLKSNTLIMVDRLGYGQHLESLLKSKTDQPIYFIQGVTEMEDRETIRTMMNDRSDVIVVAMSKIFSTGINIPNLNNILILNGKSFVRIIQSIGRSLRLYPTKTRAYIFDIYDNTRYSYRHAEERIKIYDKEKYPYKIKKINL